MKHFLRTIALSITLILPLYATEVSDAEVIAIGIGERNSTLDESKFPNTTVYYTPSIKITHMALGEKKFSGNPSFLAKWFNTSGEANDFLVLGKNGIVYDQGKSIVEGQYMEKVETERKGSFERAAYAVTVKDRTLKESRKPLDVSDEKGFIRRRLPSFTMTDTEGNSVNSTSVFENGKPKLVIFFYLNPDTYIGSEKESGDEIRSKEYMRGRMESSSGVEGVRALIQVERELFGNIVHDIY